MTKKLPIFILISLLTLSLSAPLHAESQGSDYKGVTDPFGDPTTYEFADEEKEDKDWFHLGRFMMLGVDAGLGIFTGGLGRTNSPGFYMGGHLIYFFDRSIAMEIAGHYVTDTDTLTFTSGGSLSIATSLIPITLAMRYYFDIRNAPKAIALANPYLLLGAGLYIRNQTVIQASSVSAQGGSTTSFGALGGAGAEFDIYHKRIYMGVDLRYNFIFFSDANDTLSGRVAQGDRSGGYFTSVLSMTYNF